MVTVLRGTLFFSILLIASIAQGAEYELHPSIAVSEEFTDNVFETGANRTSDFITRVLPGLAAKYKAPALNGEISYLLDYRHYARETAKDETTHAVNVKGQLIPPGNFFYLDLSEEFQRVSLDVTRDVTRESLFVNQADRNVARVSPYIMFNPSERVKVKTGYRYIDTRYFSDYGVDKTDHIVFLEVANEMSQRFSLTADYAYTREISSIDNFNQHQVLGGGRYEYADKSFLFAQAGHAWIEFDSGHDFNNVIWNAGLTHAFATVTATVTTGVTYNEDPLNNVVQEGFVKGIIEKRFQWGLLNFSPYYSEYVQTETNKLLTKKYGAVAQGHFDINSSLSGRLACLAEKYEQQSHGNDTWRFQADSGLSYPLAKQITTSLSYVYVGYFASGTAAENRHVNRAMFEIKKTF